MGNRATGSDLFLTADWFELLAAHGHDLGPSVEAYVLRDPTGVARAVLPTTKCRHPSAIWGNALTGFSNFYSSLFGPAGDTEVAAWGAWVRAIRPHTGVLALSPLDANAPFVQQLEQALQAEGWWSDRWFCFGNWYLEVGGRRFDDYYEAVVPSRIRNTIRRGAKKLKESGRSQMEVVRSPGPALEQAISDWQHIYSRSWKQPEPFPNFVPELCRMTAARGWLRMGVVRLDQTPIAAQIWFVHSRRALIFKLAYDENQRQYSAGSVLTSELMRTVLDDDRVDEVDYLTGDDAYKADWMSNRRERIGVIAFDPTRAQGLASAFRHFGGRWMARRRQSPPGGRSLAASLEHTTGPPAQLGMRR